MVLSNRNLALLCLAAVPAFILFLAIMLTLIPKHMDGLSQFMPLVYMPVVFFWAVHYPRHMPYWLVFVAGLLIDAIGGQPLGVSSLLMMGFLIVLHRRYKTIHKEGFVLQWAMFALILGGMFICQWLIMAIYHQMLMSPIHGLIQWFLTLCLYPLLHQVFDVTHQAVQNRRYQLLHSR
ncbi:MAG: rod shape-determining protein MreD [Rickettsiales bacterium]|jgi:rod shape-determining protein MreD|nr:rod shape-determining protein MreD [Rickettsiales bacterium]